ncbi:MAG: MCP four helix bundle domain-containing protein, partial [Ethanoligenens sp.]
MEKGIEPQIEKKSSLSHKINLASSIPVVLISIIMSIVSIIIFLLSMSNSSAVYNSNIKELNLLQQFSENYLQTRVNLLRMQTRTTTAEITSDQQQLNKYRAGMQNNLVQLQKLASHSPDAQKDYKQLQNAVKQYDTVTDARLQLALNRNTDAL